MTTACSPDLELYRFLYQTRTVQHFFSISPAAGHLSSQTYTDYCLKEEMLHSGNHGPVLTILKYVGAIKL